jgi:glycosyltransferase involved in cell wall biosynthesis
MSSAGRPAISVVIPAFEEEARLAGPLREVARWLASKPGDCEIVVVDDGSRDATSRIVRETARDLPVPVVLVRYARNAGKGFALKVGFAHARGERILFTDADLSTPIAEGDKLLAQLEAGYDVAIGSRWLTGSKILRHQPWLRQLMGVVFTLIVWVLVARVADATCGFKAYRGDVGRELFSRARIADWSFDAELLWIGRRLGLSLSQVPVEWSDVAGSKVRLGRDVIGSALGLLRIRWNAALGRYERPHAIDVPLEVWRSR